MAMVFNNMTMNFKPILISFALFFIAANVSGKSVFDQVNEKVPKERKSSKKLDKAKEDVLPMQLIDSSNICASTEKPILEPLVEPEAEPAKCATAPQKVEMKINTQSVRVDSLGQFWVQLEPSVVQPTIGVPAQKISEPANKPKKSASAQNAKSSSFDRGITQNVFVPKGQWLVGGNLSYADYKGDDYKFLILDAIKGDGYTLKLSPFVGYFFKDNMAAGVRLIYSRNYFNIGNIDLKLSDDLNFGMQNYSTLQHTYSGAIYLRNYLSLGESKRFGLFNETRLTIGAGQGKIVNGSGESITGTYQKIVDVQLGLAPGLVAFITDNVGIEVSVGVLGLKYKSIKQVTNQVEMGSWTKTSANFKIDLFSINLGIAFYINSMKGLNPFNYKFRRGKQIHDETEFEKSIAL